MNTNLSSSVPSQLETDCLVVVVLDRSEKDQSEKDKPAPSVECSDAAVREAVKDVISSGEVTGKTFETTLLHRPPRRRRQSQEFFSRGITQTRRRRRAHPEGEKHPQLYLRSA